MSEYIGIDFGTTNTAVIKIDDKNKNAKLITKLGENGEYPFASMIAINKNDGRMMFGREVKDKREELSKDYKIISSLKSVLGTGKEILVADKKYTATDLAALFFIYVKHILNNVNTDIKEAVIAVPANFNEKQRNELLQAANIAEINIKSMITESTAAYISNAKDVNAYSKVMVVDWGGGTLDVSILGVDNNKLYEKSVYGRKYGGDDIDELLAKHICRIISLKTGNNVGFEQLGERDKDTLIKKAEEAKIKLSDTEDDVVVRFTEGCFDRQIIDVSYDDFCDLLAKPLEIAEETINEALKRADEYISNIDAVFLVGGSSALKPYQDKLESILGDKVVYPEDVQWAIAKGASVIASMNTEYHLSEDIGLVLSNDDFFALLKKGAKIGNKIDDVSFGIVDDETSARFVFAFENKVPIKYESIKVKGFLEDKVTLSGVLNKNQTLTVSMKSNTSGDCKEINIDKIKFYYDLENIPTLEM